MDPCHSPLAKQFQRLTSPNSKNTDAPLIVLSLKSKKHNSEIASNLLLRFVTYIVLFHLRGNI